VISFYGIAGRGTRERMIPSTVIGFSGSELYAGRIAVSFGHQIMHNAKFSASADRIQL